MLLRIEEDDQIRVIEGVTHFVVEEDNRGWRLLLRTNEKLQSYRFSGTVRALNQFGIEVAVCTCRTRTHVVS